MSVDIAPTTVCDANIRITRYDIDALRDRYPGWDDWPKHTRRRYCEHAAAPETVERVANVTCDALHEYYATVLTLEPGDGDRLDPPNEIAFGDDTSSFLTSDTAMNNEVGERLRITDVSSSGKDTNFDEYLSSNEQNGNTLSEIGVFSEGGEMYQHAALSQSYSKDSTFALSINITVSHSDN
jgi:hypothetical protein